MVIGANDYLLSKFLEKRLTRFLLSCYSQPARGEKESEIPESLEDVRVLRILPEALLDVRVLSYRQLVNDSNRYFHSLLIQA